jgi:hypothetical protein
MLSTCSEKVEPKPSASHQGGRPDRNGSDTDACRCLAGRRVDREAQVVRTVDGQRLLSGALLAGVLGCTALGSTRST